MQRFFKFDYQWKVLFTLSEFKVEIVENWVPLTKSVWKAWEVLETASNIAQTTPTNVEYYLQKLDKANSEWANWSYLARRLWELKNGIPIKCNVTIYYRMILDDIKEQSIKGGLN